MLREGLRPSCIVGRVWPGLCNSCRSEEWDLGEAQDLHMAVHQNGQVDGAGYILSNELHCLLVTVAEDELVWKLTWRALRALLWSTCIHCLLL